MAAPAREGSPISSGDNESQPSEKGGNAISGKAATRNLKVKKAFSITGDKQKHASHSSHSFMSGEVGQEPNVEKQGPQKEVVVLAGMLLKRGGDKPDSIFRHRWVRVTNKGIGYNSPPPLRLFRCSSRCVSFQVSEESHVRKCPPSFMREKRRSQ
jgi:hypothetical protein